MSFDLEKFTSIRRRLHAHPELSGKESHTSRLVKTILGEFGITEFETGLGGHGVLATINGSQSGPRLLVRSELDALPIQETNTFDHRSKVEGVSHKCGHDGHMAICLAVTEFCVLNRANIGQVSFLFQPAEETGEGAKSVHADLSRRKISFDEVIALHNVPGFRLGEVVVKEGTFTPAVQTLKIKLNGKTAHAAEPENGINPSNVFPAIIDAATSLTNADSNDQEFTLITPVHYQLGEKSFGVSAGRAELYFTIRSWSKEVLDNVTNRFKEIISDACSDQGIYVEFDSLEVFENNVNQQSTNEKIIKAASKAELSVQQIETPFRWGEDFGVFTRRTKGSMFGLGAGENIPALHNPDYDFPDELIEKGYDVLKNFILLSYENG